MRPSTSNARRSGDSAALAKKPEQRPTDSLSTVRSDCVLADVVNGWRRRARADRSRPRRPRCLVAAGVHTGTQAKRPFSLRQRDPRRAAGQRRTGRRSAPRTMSWEPSRRSARPLSPRTRTWENPALSLQRMPATRSQYSKAATSSTAATCRRALCWSLASLPSSTSSNEVAVFLGQTRISLQLDARDLQASHLGIQHGASSNRSTCRRWRLWLGRAQRLKGMSETLLVSLHEPKPE
jgi:hypothetical protein